MTRLWLGIFFLACSWVAGTHYFYSPHWPLWSVLVLAGSTLVCWSQFHPGQRSHPPSGMESAGPSTAAGGSIVPAPLLLAPLFLPLALLLPWPDRLAPCLIAAGMVLTRTRGRFFRLGGLAQGLLLAGSVFWTQSLALDAYTGWTSRSHELPGPLAWILLGASRLLHLDAALAESSLMLPTMRQTHALGATWELFLDPVTFCFLAGALPILGLMILAPPTQSSAAPEAPAESPSRAVRRRAARAGIDVVPKVPFWFRAGRWKPLVLCGLACAIWLPLRVALLTGLYLHRALLTDYDATLELMSQFWSPWLQILLLLPLALLHARWLRRVPPHMLLHSVGSVPTLGARVPFGPAALAAGAALCLALGVHWDPIGTRQAGRVAVDEFHSKWEPTGRPFDTEWYGHLSGYNYACIYDYASRFYDMTRLTNAIDDRALRDLDVLMVKVPTERFGLEEIGALLRFVERGGGLLLIGEHTDVFGTGYNLNAIAQRFGFTFRYDCLFGIDSFFDQYYRPSFPPHPIVQHVRGMDFATSCSIAPRGGPGRSVITSTGLKNSLADYHVSNYYPQAVDHAAMRSGAFVQLWTTRRGAGRVVAFTDSTIFSNFCTFEPGKAELMLGMLEWLNRRDRIGHPRLLLTLAGSILLAWTLFRLRQHPHNLWAAAAAAALVWPAVAFGLSRLQLHQMPPPEIKRPFVQITVDRTACHGPLSKNGFIEGKPDGFGIFERWMLRLGYFNRRESGPAALAGNLVVYLFPTKTVPQEYLRAMTNYVDAGGRILILDDPENKDSTAAALLQPFGLSQRPLVVSDGMLSGPQGFPSIPVESANEIVGGIPWARLGQTPVGAMVRHGRGSVTVVGFGSRFTDMRMGVTGDVEPNSELRKVFDFQFALLRGLVEDTLAGEAPGEPNKDP